MFRFSLITRTREQAEDQAGTRVDIEGGSEPKVSVVGAAAGTVIEARDLFFNMPARLKFLKSRATETGHVANVVTRAALAYPALAFTLFADKRRTREFLPAKSFGERAQAVLRRNAQTPVLVQADETVPYGRVVTGAVLLQQAGATKIGFQTDPGGTDRDRNRNR